MAPHAEVPEWLANGNGHVNGNSAALNGAFDYANGASSANNDLFVVDSPNVKYTDTEIQSKYTYRTTCVHKTSANKYVATPKEVVYDFKLSRKVGKVGVMLVGWGGNNGTTVTAGIIANRRNLVWDTKEGKQRANYYGSVVMGSTIKLGTDGATGEEVHIPFHDLLPIVHPNDLVIGGWDISGMNLEDAMDRAKVLEPGLKSLVRKEMASMKPLKSIYYPDFIAANQGARVDNVLEGDKACMGHVEQIREDIRYAQIINMQLIPTESFILS